LHHHTGNAACPNAVRLDIQASSLLFTGKVASTTMRRAAELSLQKGFTQFRFEQAAMAGLGAGGRLLVGQRIGPARLLATRVCRRPYTSTAGVAMTVLMLTAYDPRATDAFDTAQVRLEAKG
jgi:hypothetical protein